jgi:Concanavalin A-like lectin/glucanases superfamily
MKRPNPFFSPALAGSKQNFAFIFPRALRSFGLSLTLGFIASCAAPKAPDTAKTDSATKPAPTPAAVPVPTPSAVSSGVSATGTAPLTYQWFKDGSIQIAGELVVGLDARDASAGADSWVDKGSMGDFAKVGSPKVATTGGQPAVTFNGTSDAYRSANPTPDTINGAHARSVEVWVFNPSVDSREESMVAWGHRGTALANMAFSYGNDTGFGAVVNYNTDMGWGEEPPAVGQWHLLTYTYDGKTAKIYDNGEQKGDAKEVALVTGAYRMVIGAENNAEGEPIFQAEFDDPWTLGFSGSIATVRVHSGALTAEQVKANFSADKARFGIAGQ